MVGLVAGAPLDSATDGVVAGVLRIAAGDDGSAWVVNDSGEIYQWSQGSFRRIPGTAVDIAANASGDVWMVGAGQGQRGRQRRR